LKAPPPHQKNMGHGIKQYRALYPDAVNDDAGSELDERVALSFTDYKTVMVLNRTSVAIRY
jgi:hypothetical protein